MRLAQALERMEAAAETLVDQRSFGLPLFMNPEDDERGGFGPRHRRVHFLQRHYDDDMA